MIPMPLRVPLGVWVTGFHTKLSPSKDLPWVLPPLSGREEMVEMGLSAESNDSNRPAGLWEEELFAIVVVLCQVEAGFGCRESPLARFSMPGLFPMESPNDSLSNEN